MENEKSETNIPAFEIKFESPPNPRKLRARWSVRKGNPFRRTKVKVVKNEPAAQ